MQKYEKALCAAYIAIALIALVATWSHNIAFLIQPGNLEPLSFFRALYVNHAAASVANDIWLMCAAAFVFMLHEAKKLGIGHVWLYILLSLLVAVSVMFPLFLVARQVALAKQRG